MEWAMKDNGGLSTCLAPVGASRVFRIHRDSLHPSVAQERLGRG